MATQRMDARHIPGSAKAHDSLVHACVELLRLHRIEAAAINQVPRRRKDGSWHTPGAPDGFPDVVACFRVGIPLGKFGAAGAMARSVGWLILVECKTGRSRVRPNQHDSLVRWNRAGALCFTVRTVDELDRALRLEGVVR